MNPRYKPGSDSAPPSKRMSGTRSHQLDLDDASAQSDLICAPQPIIIDQTQAAQIGGYRSASAERACYYGVTLTRSACARAPAASPGTWRRVPDVAPEPPLGPRGRFCGILECGVLSCAGILLSRTRPCRWQSCGMSCASGSARGLVRSS